MQKWVKYVPLKLTGMNRGALNKTVQCWLSSDPRLMIKEGGGDNAILLMDG